ncbi:hypothetical protein COL154_004409 [Colletotrichum chrysophilum]|nr:hypothetical protein COL154_004409 [Colletotrichum chrysophilum]
MACLWQRKYRKDSLLNSPAISGIAAKSSRVDTVDEIPPQATTAVTSLFRFGENLA